MSPFAMTDRLTSQDKVSELLTALEDIYNQYKVSSRNQMAVYEQQVVEFRKQLEFVDGVRETYLEPYIQAMYQLLSMVGSPSRKLTKLPLIPEKAKTDSCKKDPVYLIYGKAVAMLKHEEEQHQIVMIKLLTQAKQNTWKLKEGQKAKNRLKREIAKQQERLEEKKKQLHQAIELVTQYRDVLMSVKETAQQKMLPELRAVHALLTALDVAENVKMNQTDHIPSTWPVIRLANTGYQMHYQFVKGAFAYYHQMLELYESPLVKELFDEAKLSPDSINQFLSLKESISKDQDAVLKTVVFYS